MSDKKPALYSTIEGMLRSELGNRCPSLALVHKLISAIMQDNPNAAYIVLFVNGQWHLVPAARRELRGLLEGRTIDQKPRAYCRAHIKKG